MFLDTAFSPTGKCLDQISQNACIMHVGSSDTNLGDFAPATAGIAH